MEFIGDAGDRLSKLNVVVVRNAPRLLPPVVAFISAAGGPGIENPKVHTYEVPLQIMSSSKTSNSVFYRSGIIHNGPE